MDYGVPLGRRFRALKLWFVMRAYGREGLAAMIREHVRMAREFAEEVKSNPRFELTAPYPLSTVCFRYKGTDDENRRIIEKVNASGQAFLTGTTLNGRFTMRLAIGNQATRQENVERVWGLIVQASEAEGRI